jgi:hypothetical protein
MAPFLDSFRGLGWTWSRSMTKREISRDTVRVRVSSWQQSTFVRLIKGNKQTNDRYIQQPEEYQYCVILDTVSRLFPVPAAHHRPSPSAGGGTLSAFSESPIGAAADSFFDLRFPSPSFPSSVFLFFFFLGRSHSQTGINDSTCLRTKG